MRQKLNEKYLNAAQEFATRVISAFGSQISSIVLYGSVAKGRATRNSDIDLLIISRNPRDSRERISEIRSDFDCERNYEFFISLAHFSQEEFHKLVQLGSPFTGNVLREGVVLYDTGTFSRVHEKAVAVLK